MEGDSLYKEISDTHVLIQDKIHLDIVVGSLADSTEDTVVNSTGTSINFSIPLSKAIAAKAGPELKDACATLVPLAFGSVEETGPYEMHCKQILHCNCHHWSEGKNVGELKKIISVCLEKAGQKSHKSIALPAIGLGVKGFPADVVATSPISAITEYSRKCPESSLKSVKLYVFEKSATPTLMQTFKSALQDLSKKVKPDGKMVDIFIGDLAETQADILVNSTGSRMSLSRGKTSLALLNKAGTALQEECDKCGPLLSGEVVATDGFGLPCNKVLHVSCPQWKKGVTEKKLQDLIRKCLDWALSSSASSIAFPAMGAGVLTYPPQSVAESFVTSAKNFIADHPDSCIKKIMLVVYSGDSATISGVEQFLGTKLSSQRSEDVSNSVPRPAVEINNNKMIIDLPSYWQKPEHTYGEFVVAAETKEWNDAVTDFKKTLNCSNVQIVELLRIQNPEMYMLYDVRRKGVALRLNKQEQEIETAPLWHGSKEESIPQITRTKFDRAMSGRVGSNMLGSGSYFSTTSEYSSCDKYSPPNAAGLKYMILSRVITGDYCLGDAAYKMPPYKPGSKYEQFDSVVNRMVNPSIFAVFHDASAYPEYIIKYKLSD